MVNAVQFRVLLSCLLIVFITSSGTPVAAGVAVTTYHYNNLRTGWNDRETTLTPANVGNLQLQQSVTLDQEVDSQPLYLPDVTIAGGKHNVVYVVTENNTIYAIDATTGAILLQRNFGTPVPVTKLLNCYGNSVVGITSTPVIDRKSKTLYVMSYTYKNNTPVYQLHALNFATLQDEAMSPVVVQAKALLDNGTYWNFDPASSHQRPALLEANGNIYAGFGSFCDFDENTSRGWLLGWQAGTLTPLAANELTNQLIPEQSPNDFFLTSIWMSGSGVAADSKGNLYFATGNSDPSGTTYSPKHNLSESVVKMSPDLMTVLDFFTPAGMYGADYLDMVDWDFGAGGVLLLPEQPGKSFLATAAGKSGLMYLLNQHKLGGHHNPNQVLGTYSIGQCWCGESYFTGWDGIGRVVSSGGYNGTIVIWKLQTSPPPPALVKESAAPQFPESVQGAGFITSVSSNGTGKAMNAIVWALGRPSSTSAPTVTLYAYDPMAGAAATAQGNPTALLLSATAGAWPNLYANPTTVPVVADGRVYVAGYEELAIFGLPSASAAGKREAATRIIPAMPPLLPKLPPDGHEIFGRIKTADGGDIALATRIGKLVRVDAADAVRRHRSVGLRVGEPVIVFGSYDSSGMLRATSVMHAYPSPNSWLADR
jgi:PQQ-like domain